MLMASAESEAKRSPFLEALGERVRNLRSRKGMTRRAVALAADVSERHLANLEYGTGNVSVLVCCRWPTPCNVLWPSCLAT
jgi:XRE family aerobic/anaerobic benzoate catabolism transcriptional regulator